MIVSTVNQQFDLHAVPPVSDFRDGASPVLMFSSGVNQRPNVDHQGRARLRLEPELANRWDREAAAEPGDEPAVEGLGQVATALCPRPARGPDAAELGNLAVPRLLSSISSNRAEASAAAITGQSSRSSVARPRPLPLLQINDSTSTSRIAPEPRRSPMASSPGQRTVTVAVSPLRPGKDNRKALSPLRLAEPLPQPRGQCIGRDLVRDLVRLARRRPPQPLDHIGRSPRCGDEGRDRVAEVPRRDQRLEPPAPLRERPPPSIPARLFRYHYRADGEAYSIRTGAVP